MHMCPMQIKLDKKGTKLRFVGYSIQSKGYRLFDEDTSKIYIRRDMVFNESDFRRNTEKVNQQQETIEVDTEPETSAQTEKSEQPREPENQATLRTYQTSPSKVWV